VIHRSRYPGFAAMAGLLAFALAACHKEEQAVTNVAQTAVNAERKAQASATAIDRERATLSQIPLPTKSLYIDVREPSAWVNPFIAVDVDTVSLRVMIDSAAPASVGQDTMLRPAAARRQELEIHLKDLPEALTALPPAAWHYGRVVAIIESPHAASKDRPMIRRNVEAAIQTLNDLGIVVQEWPSR
jgi:hypothetical protein